LELCRLDRLDQFGFGFRFLDTGQHHQSSLPSL
jgi:hypothetical protein